MTIPKYDDLFVAALSYLQQHGTTPWKQLEAPLAAEFGLAEQELSQEYESGNGKVFLDRVSWSLSSLSNTGLAQRPKRGHYEITDLGIQYLAQPDKVKGYVKQALTKRRKAQQQNAPSAGKPVLTGVGDTSEQTPHEQMLSAYDEIRSAQYETIIDTILSKSPYEFEKLVVKLMSKLGYGGEFSGAAVVTQRSNDGGIDGVIKEDVLGLGHIHLQAKRYKLGSNISREDVQKFVGALAVAQSNKGVFITTSNFTAGARAYADSLNGTTNLVLINGAKLAEYIYNTGLGMQVEQTLVIRKMDADFWDGMLEANSA